MSVIDGRLIATAITSEVSEDVAALRVQNVSPTLAVLVPTRNEATAWYVRSIQRAAAKVGVDSRVVQIDNPSEADVVQALAELSADDSVHGIICQTPLPEGVRLDKVAEHIAPSKDVDGANPLSLGRLSAGLPSYPPATAAAVLEILRRESVQLRGARVVVVGRSTVVGKPVALLLVNEHATVTICHSYTENLTAATAEADVLVVAVGRAGFIGAEHVRPGVVVIDVGTNPTDDGGLVGDVEYEEVARVAGSITPVPGGVGPVTTAVLLRHTVTAARG